MVQAIKAGAAGQLRYAYDAISEKGTLETIAEAFEDKGGKISECWSLSDWTSFGLGSPADELIPPARLFFRTLLATAYTLTYDDALLSSLPSNITTTRTLVATAYGDDTEFAAKYYRLAGDWLEKGELKGMKVTVVDRGLEGVDEGLKRLQEGKISGEKLVYRIEDTPALKKVQA